MSGRRFLFDIETNGLLDEVSIIHSIVLYDPDRKEWISCADQPGYVPISEGLKLLHEADRLYGHNILLYDIPALEKITGLKWDRSKIVDTLLLARILWPEIKQGDMFRWKQGTLPGRLIGSHSLKAWGYRLGVLKGDFSEDADWSTWTKAMQTYCEQDVRVTLALYRQIGKKFADGTITPRVYELERRVADLCFRMTVEGFTFDVKAAGMLYADLAARSNELFEQIQRAFPPIERITTIIPKVNNKVRGYVKGVPFQKRKMEALKPKGREQLAERLKLRYGWDAPRDGRTGRVNLDDAVLAKLDFPEIPIIREYYAIEKALGMLAIGKNAWLKLERNGRIHGEYETAGAVTGRATHKRPNIAQVMKVAHDGDGNVLKGLAGGFGFECRSLFTVPPGWTLVGADMSGLELRCLGHYLSIYDDGAYVSVVLDGDVHTVNMKAAGLPTRDKAKTFIYAYLYGAGDELIGAIVLPNASAAEQKKAGKRIKAQFLKGMPALAKLRDKVREAAERGWIEGIDGRRLTIRKPHAALNTLLQSAGAIVCKQWIVMIYDELLRRGLKWGLSGDFSFCAWVHDEVQIACRTPEIAETVAQVCKDMATAAGEALGFDCRLNGDAKIGRTWAETH
ncbi:DNA polymerase [Komagataeibacter sp. FNDCR2]|uniref:DNA polymerase n=1 Tax=Komagataeibacter sp. FNDCR2 TaxID=2878682 RepID=UPI001E39B83C|nr:DNA polymerase [Komagataeibacter sp. FNDCR2]MCE2576888.1 hypothetical protein [Komagataeibacter sp. FNDCR2]